MTTAISLPAAGKEVGLIVTDTVADFIIVEPHVSSLGRSAVVPM